MEANDAITLILDILIVALIELWFTKNNNRLKKIEKKLEDIEGKNETNTKSRA